MMAVEVSGSLGPILDPYLPHWAPFHAGRGSLYSPKCCKVQPPRAAGAISSLRLPPDHPSTCMLVRLATEPFLALLQIPSQV